MVLEKGHLWTSVLWLLDLHGRVKWMEMILVLQWWLLRVYKTSFTAGPYLRRAASRNVLAIIRMRRKMVVLKETVLEHCVCIVWLLDLHG